MEILIRPARPTRSFAVPHLPALQITGSRIAIARPRRLRIRITPAAQPPVVVPVPADPASSAWLDGRLRKARALYERTLRQHGNDWPARFQLAWLAAAFGRLDPHALAGLARDDLSDAGRDRLRALASFEERPPLDGDELAWDIDVLRTAGASEDAAWWEGRGHAAWVVGLFGVAAACASEAAARSPASRAEPPAWARVAADHAAEHLRRIASAVR